MADFTGFEKVRQGHTTGLLRQLRNLFSWDGTALTINVGQIADSNGPIGPEAVASIDLSSTTTITHTFEDGWDYWLDIEGSVPTDDNVDVFLRFNGDDSGTAYVWVVEGQDSGGTVRGDVDGSDSEIELNPSGQPVGNDTGEHFNGHYRIRNGASTSLYKMLGGTSIYFSSSALAAEMTVAGVWKNTAALTSITIDAAGATGGFSAGTATLYRSRRS